MAFYSPLAIFYGSLILHQTANCILYADCCMYNSLAVNIVLLVLNYKKQDSCEPSKLELCKAFNGSVKS